MKIANPKVVIAAVVIIILGIVFFVSRSSGDESFRELALEERPYASLVPRSDGHWLKLTIENFKVKGATTLEYVLIYQVPDGASQGVPGTIEIGSEDRVERDLLLGSESAGKFRYDEGVTDGELQLTFKGKSGKKIAELVTAWKLYKGETDIVLEDFSYKMADTNDDEYMVAMQTFGLPKALEGAKGQVYGVFASGGEPYPGMVTLADSVRRWDGDGWREVVDGKSPNIGVFVEVAK